MPGYPTLFSPIRIGPVTIRNRIVQTAHVKLFSERGIDSRRNLLYQVERARGGVGLIIAGNRLVHPTSASANPRLFAWAFHRNGIDVDRRMTSAVHAEGAAIFAQLNHLGVHAASDSADDPRTLLGPSRVRSPAYGEAPKEMEPEDIAELVRYWARSAANSRDSGFDGVEVHVAHSYLLHEFLSPLYNKRTDEYGGSAENRARFACEVVRAVRAEVGADFVVGVRLAVSDVLDGGLTVDDAADAARMLRAAGELDYLNVSAAGYHNIHLAFGPSDLPDGWLVDRIGALKQQLGDLPVIAVGGLQDPDQAERLLREGKADLVAMTRAQIADPELARKLQEGREDEVVHCIRFNQGCFARSMRGLPIACTVNPAAGREARYGAGRVAPAELRSHWLVIGGGPSGMKAAATLAERGHDVTLLEASGELGGQTKLIARSPGREGIELLTGDLAGRLRRHGVEVRLDTVADVDAVAAVAADSVVVATGALADRGGFSAVAPTVDSVPGADAGHVLTGWDVLGGEEPAGARVVVLDDEGTRYCAGVCEHLLDRGHEVELVTRLNGLFPSTFQTMDLAVVHERLFRKGLAYRLCSWVREIEPGAVRIYNVFTGAETTIDAVDAVVLTTGSVANDALYRDLKRAGVPNLRRIGDCVSPRRLDHAIYEGYLVGCELDGERTRFISEDELYVEPLPSEGRT